MHVGLLIMDEDLRVGIQVAKAADAAGIHSVWSIDYYNRNSLVRAAAFAAATESVLVGTSVTPVFARAALATATAATDVQSISGGRFVLGLGTSTRRMNQDWYDVVLEHPAPRMVERVELIRELLAHHSGPFAHRGRFDTVELAHLERAVDVPDIPIYCAGVGPAMVRAAGAADGFVGHPIASAEYLRQVARPALDAAAAERGRTPPAIATQIVASADDDAAAARRRAAQQVGFYSTVKGYDPLFTGDLHLEDRQAAREAFAVGDVDGVARAAGPLVDERAVFGSTAEIGEQLVRYQDLVDTALLYSPHFGVSAEEITRNEMALIEVAACWT